jgi:arabinose-5-phosphate isomerase
MNDINFSAEDIKTIIKHEADAILNIPVTHNFFAAIDLIYNCVHLKKGKLVASGSGKAGQIALNIATTFSSTGTPSVFLHPADAQHGDLGIICENDILLVISNSGKTREIIELIELTQKFYSSIPCILITGNPNSPIANMSNIVLSTGNPKEVCPLGLTPTTSTTTMTVIGDILVVMMMKKIDFTPEEYAKRHHGGYLGDKSRKMIKY